MVNRPGTKILYLLLLISALLAGCKKENSPAEPQTDPQYGAKEEFFPLHEGNTWLYIDSTYDYRKKALEFARSGKIKITDRLTLNYKGRNMEVYTWNYYFMYYYQFTPGESEFFCRNDSDGMAYYGGRQYKLDIGDFDSNYVHERYLQYKYPVKNGDTWNSVIYYHGPDSFYIGKVITRTCVSEDTLFKTGRGYMHCVVYRYSETYSGYVLDTYEYLAKGIGLVGVIEKADNKISYKRSLQQYTLY